MCNSSLSSLKIRSKLKKETAKSSIQERRKLKKVFKELESRSGSTPSGILRDVFFRFTELPGLFGEQLFTALDENDDDLLDARDFLNGIVTLYKGALDSLSELLFKIFDFGKNGYISSEEILYILAYLPEKCPRCGEVLLKDWDIQSKANSLLGGRDFIRLEDFSEVLLFQPEIGRVILQSILSSLPPFIEEVFFEKELRKQSIYSGILRFKKRTYKFVLKNQALYYFPTESQSPYGMILIKDLYVAKLDEFAFELRNSKLSYSFKADNEETINEWIGFIKKNIGFKDIVQDYKLLESVGKGAYGKVKLAENLKTKQRVAVKIIAKEPLDDRSETRIRKEISILKLCKHESLLNLIDFYETPSNIYLVTEYLPEGTLFSYMQERNFKIPEATARDLVRDIAAGLNYLHSYGIIHRDIKLENVLVATHKNRLKARIIDFGLSCMLGPGQTSMDTVGTLKYAAPELLSKIPYRESVDAWGLGVIAHILLTGRMPFNGKDEQDVINGILKRNVSFDGMIWSGVSSEAKRVLKALLTRNPSNRISLMDLLDEDWLSDQQEEVTVEIPSSFFRKNSLI